MSPAGAIVVSSKDEAEATPRAATPTVSDLLCDIPNTPKVAPSSGAGHAEGASTSEGWWKIPFGPLRSDVIIVEPPIVGVIGDLVRSRPDTSFHSKAPLVWVSTEGDPYFILDDVDERGAWAEFRAQGHVWVLASSLPRFLVP
jgi:hypothetical protein